MIDQEKYIKDKRAVKISNPFTKVGFIRFDNPTHEQRQLLEYFKDLTLYIEGINELLREHPNDYLLGFNVRNKTRSLNEAKGKIG